jgi:hypothetical protein
MAAPELDKPGRYRHYYDVKCCAPQLPPPNWWGDACVSTHGTSRIVHVLRRKQWVEHFRYVALGALFSGPFIGLYGEPDLGSCIVHTGHDPHHTTRLGLRENGPRYATACSGLRWRK